MSKATSTSQDLESTGRHSDDLAAVLEEVVRISRPAAAQGEVASYLPSLRAADPGWFGLAMVEMDGRDHAVGDADQTFAIQSVSKVFSLVLAMQKADQASSVSEELWQRVQREPSGDPFNSLVQLEHERGIPRNPMVNAGALVVDDVLFEFCDDAPAEMIALVSELAGEEVGVDQEVRRGEEDTGHRNRAMASLLKSFGNLRNDVEDVLDTYNHQCAVTMTSRQLARAVRFLANDGIDPASGRKVLSPQLARRVAAIMLTCGTYDSAGEFAYSVGLPCKSGVAGSIIALVPDQFGICVWSPPLDDSGNSLAGRAALHELSERLDLTVF